MRGPFQKIPYFFLYLLLVAGATAQPVNKVISFCPDTIFASDNMAQYAEDSFFIAAGNTYIPGTTSNNIFTARLDYKGQVQKSSLIFLPNKYYKFNSTDYELNGASSPMSKMSNNKYVLTANNIDSKINKKIQVYQPFLYIFGDQCDSLCFKEYDDTIVSRLPYSITADNNNDLIVTGMISSDKIYYDSWDQSYNWDSTYIWLAKYDSNTNLLWERKYFANDNYGNGNSGFVSGYKVIANAGAYLIFGLACNSAAKKFDLIIFKTDLSGNILWAKFLPRPLSLLGKY